MRLRASHIFEKERYGHYVEPSWCTRRLFEVERFRGPIIDPSCGWGRITRAAQRAGYEAFGSDIVDRKYHLLGDRFARRDFLTWHGRIVGSVVCNPPFDYVREFCERSLELGASKVAMIALVRSLNAARWLRDLPLRRVWLLTPRPSMPPGSYLLKGKKPKGGREDFCWLVLESKYEGEASINWLTREVNHERLLQSQLRHAP